jgi:hypothetical protein
MNQDDLYQSIGDTIVQLFAAVVSDVVVFVRAMRSRGWRSLGIQIKRVYEEPGRGDGERILVAAGSHEGEGSS